MTENQASDVILLERFNRGDRDAMNALVHRHRARAYSFAFRLTKDQDLAADIVAEAFLRIYKSCHAFKGQSSFTTWVYRIVTNCFLDTRKRARNRRTVALEWLDSSQSTEVILGTHGHSQPFDTLVASEQQRSLSQRIAELSDSHRIILTLYHGEMLSYEEIASTLDLPVGTVKSRLNRARLCLRAALRAERSLFELVA